MYLPSHAQLLARIAPNIKAVWSDGVMKNALACCFITPTLQCSSLHLALHPLVGIRPQPIPKHIHPLIDFSAGAPQFLTRQLAILGQSCAKQVVLDLGFSSRSPYRDTRL